jgi:hypothetical protein
MAAILALAAAAGCGGTREEFIGGRARDACNQTWPVCDRVVGCVLGTQTFISGRFPGQTSFLVRLAEPATVTVSVFIEAVGGTGTDPTYIHFFEEGCRSRIRRDVPAAAFVAEAERNGVFSRSADLVGIGDHLIELFSDAQAQYMAKVDVVLQRDQGTDL